MKQNNLMKIISIFLLLVCISGCSKGFDDRLRGKWQLREYIHGTESAEFNQVFYNFSRQVLQIQAPGASAYGQFFQEGDSLILELPDHDQVPEAFTQFGWESTVERVAIRKLSRSKLELSRGDQYWVLRKF
ncbi:MAG: lipocalin-like domain-containing protein [Bacteroidales bacterium]